MFSLVSYQTFKSTRQKSSKNNKRITKEDKRMINDFD